MLKCQLLFKIDCLRFNNPLRQSFSLYRTVSQREGEREKRGERGVKRQRRLKMSKQPPFAGVGRVVRRCWVNFQCRGVLLIWIIVGQGPTALVVGAGGGCLDIFSLICHFSFLSPSLWETARYRLKYCLKGPLSQKQPTNQPISHLPRLFSFSLSLGDGPI